MINRCIGCYYHDCKENVCTHGSPIFIDDECTDYEDNDFIEQIKAEAIDEYKIALHTKYKENKNFAYSVWEGNIYKYDAMANLDLEEIDEIAEQLKEQK